MFDSRREGISGSKFTIAFVLFLVLGVVFGFLAAIRFQKTMTAFDDVRLKWPAAAASIDEQIQSIDSSLKTANVAAPTNSVESWDKCVSDFRESSQYDRQIPRLAPLLDAWKGISKHASGDSERLFPERTPPVVEFIEADSALGALQSDWLGKICQMIFGLNLSDRVGHKI
jgi:uncharacterized membrane protein YjgN (DUF898 family)